MHSYWGIDYLENKKCSENVVLGLLLCSYYGYMSIVMKLYLY